MNIIFQESKATPFITNLSLYICSKTLKLFSQKHDHALSRSCTVAKTKKDRVLPLLVCWSRHAGTKDFCFALAALVDPVQNLFPLTVDYFKSFVPIAQQAGQAVVLGRPSFSMCLWTKPNILPQFLWRWMILLSIQWFWQNFIILMCGIKFWKGNENQRPVRFLALDL